MSKISDTLGKLDPANDNHWTSDGLPRIDTVRMLASDPTLNRDAITAEAPDFTRTNLILGGATTLASAPVVTIAPAPVVEPAPVVAQTALQAMEQHLAENELTAEEFDNLIFRGQEALQHAISDLNVAQQLVNDTQNQLDAAINAKHAAHTSDSTMSVIQGYLASQQANLTERGRRAQVLRDSGVTLNDIKALIPQPSDLDKALASKKR